LFKRSSDNLITTWDWMALNLRKVFKLGILLWRDHFLHLTLLSFLSNSRGGSPLNFCFFSWRKQDTLFCSPSLCAFFYFCHYSLVFRIFVWNNCNWMDLPYYSVEETILILSITIFTKLLIQKSPLRNCALRLHCDIVIGKIWWLGGENGQFWHNRESNA
jgi:hypothetical protein